MFLPVSLNTVFLAIFLLTLLVLVLFGLGFFVFTMLRSRGREASSVNSVLLQIAVPRGNEIKIDAMEQFFSSLSAKQNRLEK